MVAYAAAALPAITRHWIDSGTAFGGTGGAR
jgi:hypothetical protein